MSSRGRKACVAAAALITAALPVAVLAQVEPRPRAADPFQVETATIDDLETDLPQSPVLVDEPITAQIVTVDGRDKKPRIQGRRLETRVNTRVDTRISSRISSRQGAREISSVLAAGDIPPETLSGEPE